MLLLYIQFNIEFPVSVKKYDKIEKQTNINVNVFGDVTVRTRHHGLSNFIDYKIPSFPFEIVGCTFALFPTNFLETAVHCI